jgi:L-galactono-1,4-lactone dehydrogenase
MYACRFYYQPENQDDLVAIVADCARAKRRLRVLGSGLSPNGVGFSEDGMMSMALLDRVVWVDPDSMRVSCCGFKSCICTKMVAYGKAFHT